MTEPQSLAHPIEPSAIANLLDDAKYARSRITSVLNAVSDRLQTPYTSQPTMTPWRSMVAPALGRVRDVTDELCRQLRHEHRRANLLELRALRAEDEVRRLRDRLDRLGYGATE